LKSNIIFRLTFLTIIALHFSHALYATDFYVSPTGNDSNDGAIASPWKTIQHSADNATAGSTVHISAGIYSERVLIKVSGNADDGYITFLGDPAGGTIVDGSGFTADNMESFNRDPFDAYGLGNASALLEIIDQSYVRVQNIEVRNYICSSTVIFPMGVLVLKQETSDDAMQDIELVNLNVHDIKNNTSSDNGGAQGLAVYGGHTTVAITNLKVIGCEIHSCILAQSESMTVNGNVDGFLIGDNSVHDNDNIGIVCIGWEGTAGPINTNSNPSLIGGHHPNDRARNGVVRNNLVYNCSTEKPIKNPTYPANDFSAGGIYIDGGKDITIEYNTIYQCDVGIEIASEHGGVDDNNDQRNTSGIVCRNNLVYYCGQYGIGIGGYDKDRGDATACKILQNTIYKCSSLGFGGGQIYINKAHHNLISGNILVARGSADVDDYDGYHNTGNDWEWDHGLVLGSSLNSTYNHDNTLDSNLYYTAAGSAAIRWMWEMTDSQDPNTGFDSLKAIDTNAVFGDPKFVHATISKADGTEDFSITDAASPAIDEADAAQIPNAGTYDFAGKPRVYNAIQDNGAYEYYPATQGMEIAVLYSSANGNPVSITDGDSTPVVEDGTEFGNVDIGTETVIKTFLIRNSGTVDLAIGIISFSGGAAADFTVTTQPSATVAPNGETTFAVIFNPSAGGDRAAKISIINNDSDENPFNFALHGTGTGAPVFTLTYSADSNGSITGTTPQTVAENEDGTPVTPTPNAGYHFVNWSDSSTDNPRTDTNVITDITVTANFAINPSYTLTVVNGSGGGTIVEGQSAAITADAPAAGFHFVNWTTPDGGTLSDAGSSDTSYAMPGNDATVTANFSDKYTLTYTAGSNGTITGTTPQQIKEGLDGTAVTATPDDGYYFVDWSDSVTTATRTDTNVIADVTVTASFAESKLTLTIDSDSIAESGGTSAATVTRNSGTTNDLIVNLSSNDTSEATVPASVTIPAGSSSAAFTVTAVKDDLVDGTQNVVISATAALHTGASDTISITDGKKVALGLQFSIKASEVANPSGGTLTEFIDRPKIYAFFTDPIKGRARKTKIKVLTDVPAADGSQVTEVTCEWKRNVLLYHKRTLRIANKEGAFTSDWLTNNPLSDLTCSLNVQTDLPDWTQIDDDIDKKLFLAPPEITDVEQLDGTALGTDSVQTESIIVLKGKYFGYKPPKVWMEYLNNRNKIKKQRLKVEKIFEYKDPRGNEEKSCMSLVTGESKIRIQMPKKWWRDWSAGSYNLIIDNKVGLATTSISTSQ
jgi:List-Bact-rpt repeat protein/HYDIN/CFA65/VesB family protein